MKKLWPSVACSAVLLSGCMYGSATAPITALNGNSQYQPTRAPVGQIQIAQGQAIALTPTRVPPPRPAVAVPQQQPLMQPPQQQELVVQAQSPYSQANAVQPTRPQSTNDDGWSVAPQTQQGVSNTNSAQSQPQNAQDINQSQPVRPVAQQPSAGSTSNNTEGSNQAAGTNNTQANSTVNSQENTQGQQVASATPPQQPAAPAKEETAVSALLKKASASLGKGDLDGAAAYLENAQRIEPQNAKILYDIANIRYHQGRYKDAETFAGRAVQVGGGNSMMKKSWALVANARKSLGDNQGAIAAAEKAASFGN